MKNKSPLQVQAYDYLKDMILSGKLEPETLYSETRMSAEIGVSRTPMREAIRCLSQDGYIIVVPNKGFMLRKLNSKDMEEMIQIRCAIEGFCIHMAAMGAFSEKGKVLLGEIGQISHRMEMLLLCPNGPSEENIRKGIWSKEKFKQFQAYDRQYHFAIINYLGNEEFIRMFQRLMYMIYLTTYGAFLVPGRAETTVGEHRQIHEYLSEGNGSAAYKQLMEHLMAPLAMNLVQE